MSYCKLVHIIVLLFFSTLFLLPHLHAQENAPATQVKSAPVLKQTVPTLIEVVGTVQADHRANLAAKISGMVTEVSVVLGSRVKKGDLLVRISAQEISAQLKQAKTRLNQAERNLKREQKLLKKQAATKETVQSMQEAYAVAGAAFQEAQSMLSYTLITAPFSGVITGKEIHIGDMATPGSILLSMEDDQNMQIACAVPESLIQYIHSGDNLEVSIPSAGLTVHGTVAEVSPSADPVSRTAPVTLTLSNNKKLRTGQFARVKLPGKTTTSYFIPQAGIVRTGQMERVFVVDQNIARLRLVRTGMRHEDMVEVLSGLTPKDQVIISNNQNLVNGQAVTVTL